MRHFLIVGRFVVVGTVAASLGATLLGAPRPHDLTVDPADRAQAMARLLDTPRPPAVVDEGILVAEQLRRRYGLVSGHRHADRVAAALRAKREVVDAARFSREEVRAEARRLGYDPDACANYCDNVERLAVVTLQRERLRRFAASEGAATGSLAP